MTVPLILQFNLCKKLARCVLGAGCDLRDTKYFSLCNCPTSDLWEKFYSREKNAYNTDQKVFGRYSHIKKFHTHQAIKIYNFFPWGWVMETVILWQNTKNVNKIFSTICFCNLGSNLIFTKTFSLFNLEHYSSLNSKGMNLRKREYRPTTRAIY